MSLSHLEKIYIENRDYIDHASKKELEMLVNTFLYQEILNNTITEEDLETVTFDKVKEIINIYLNNKKVLKLNK
ncbi:MAG: hypothetical protein IJH20_02735 [Bacilli bacterium]|nr:hypothetical protein [Bacilli bacterium]